MSTMRSCCSLGGGVRGLRHRAHQLGRRAARRLTCAGVDAFGDLLPRRGLDLLGRGAAVVGQLEKPLAAFAFGADDEALVDQQLQRRVDRAGAGPPQALAALGDLLDHLVAVHRPLGEQSQDGRADVAALAASASAATAARAAESEAAAADRSRRGRARSRSRPESRGRTGRPVGAVLADVVAELATGMSPLLVQRAACWGSNAEAESCPVWASGCEWVVHVCLISRFWSGTRLRFPIRQRYIGNYRDATYYVMRRLSESRPITQRAHSASMRVSRRPYSRAARPKNRPSPSVQSMESLRCLESLDLGVGVLGAPRPCACGPARVRSRRAGRPAAAGICETAGRPAGSIIHRCSSARPACGDAVLLAAARPDVGHLDQPGIGELVELAVELALGGGPDVGHRLLERLQQVVSAAGLLGQQAERRHPQTHGS